jgi:ribonuclease BN (tRNA processing enzyme)
VRLAVLGARGSTPAPGRDFADYGGHTSCLAVFGDGDDRPRLVLDAGTGLTSLPALMAGAPFVGDIVLSHLHWDHVQGLPFCPSVDRRDAQVRLHVPVAAPAEDPVALLARSMSPPHFPISPTGLLGRWEFAALLTGRVELGHAAPGTVLVAPIEHKGGIAYGIRVELDGAALAYLPDHAVNGLSGADTTSARGLAQGVDLLVHDGQYLAGEVVTARAYGHATIEAAADFADACGVAELMLTHHGPGRTDADIDRLAGSIPRTPGGIPVRFARQGGLLPIGRRS